MFGYALNLSNLVLCQIVWVYVNYEYIYLYLSI